MEIYGAAVADRLDAGRGILQRRFYRQHCTPDLGSYTKDLTAICNDLSSVFILDNSPGAYRAYPGESEHFNLLNNILSNVRLIFKFFFDVFVLTLRLIFDNILRSSYIEKGQDKKTHVCILL